MIQQAYINGFMHKCAEEGVDPQKLLLGYSQLQPNDKKMVRRKFFPSWLSYLNPGNYLALGSAKVEMPADYVPYQPAENIAQQMQGGKRRPPRNRVHGH